MSQKIHTILKSLLAGVVVFLADIPSASAAGPPAPTLSVSAPLELQTALTWSASSGASTYNIYRSTTPASEALLKSGVVGTTFEDSGLNNGQTYYYKVSGVNSSSQEGPLSNEISVTTKAAPPSGLSGTAGDSQVSLTWNSSTSATSYRIYRDTLGGPGGATSFTVNGTSTIDTGLVNSTTYYYQVAAINASGENSQTGPTLISVIPVAANGSEAPTGAPANLTVAAGTGSALLHWSPASNAATYHVYRGTSTNLETMLPTALTTTSFTDTGLTNGTLYYYKVRAENGAQVSSLSSEVTVTPHVPAKPAPTATASSRCVVLNWTPDGTSYAIYRGLAAGSETLIDSGLTGNTYTDAGLVNGVTYYYKVQSLNSGGSSPLSAEVSATPSGPAPQSWTGSINFSLGAEPVQSCFVYLPDVNRPVLLALFCSQAYQDILNNSGTLQALAVKYNAIIFNLDGFAPFSFGSQGNMATSDDSSHIVNVIDYRWPELSALRIQQVLNAAVTAVGAVKSHPEIANTGIVLDGFSEGTDNIGMTVVQPSVINRILAVIQLTEVDEDRYNRIANIDIAPHLLLAAGEAGSQADGNSTLSLKVADFSSFSSTPTHDAYVRGLATNQGAPFTVINDVGVGHGGNPDLPFISIWLDSILSQRLPATLPTSTPVTLPSWQNTSAWTGTYNVTISTSSPWKGSDTSGVQTTGNQTSSRNLYTSSNPFTWLPSQNTATSWASYLSSGAMSPAFNPVILTPSSATATMGTPYTNQIIAINFPTSYNATGLPAGLTVNTNTGVITGTPTVSGTFSITITATNSTGTTTATLSLTVSQTVAPPGSIDSPTMPVWGLLVLAALLISVATRQKQFMR